jgi:plastocyanin
MTGIQIEKLVIKLYREGKPYRDISKIARVSFGQIFEHIFNQTGTFGYYCTLNSNIIGQVIVS